MDDEDKEGRSFEELIAAIPATMYVQRGRFAPKLDFEARCEVLALYRQGVARSIIAEAYGIDRRTVTHIQNPNSPHYKGIREEAAKLGADEFQRHYITEQSLSRIARARKVSKDMPNKLANKRAGLHVVRNENCSYDHRVFIDWVDDGVLGPGWYYQDLESGEEWLHNDESSIVSSQACLRLVEANLFDI